MRIRNCVWLWIVFCSVMESWVQSKCFRWSCPCHYNDEASRTGSFFGYPTTKWKQPTSSRPGQTKHNFCFPENGCCRRARMAQWSAPVSSGCARGGQRRHQCGPLSYELRLPRCHQETSHGPEMTSPNPQRAEAETRWRIVHSQTGLCVPAWRSLWLQSQRANTTVTNTNECDSLYLQSGSQFGFMTDEIIGENKPVK